MTTVKINRFHVGRDYPQRKCAFQSLEHMFKWFSEVDRHNLRRAGFYITVLQAKSVYVGRKQVVFNRRSAKIVTKLPLKQPEFT